jgi:hypothetical protein
MGKPGLMRDSMPKVAAWVDALRQAFGREHIDECIRRGMVSSGGAWEFTATENGHVVGRKEKS